MSITLTKLTQETDGIPGWVAYPNAAGRHPAVLMLYHAPGLTGDYKLHCARLAQMGYAVFVPQIFNMLGFPGDSHPNMGAEIQEKRTDADFLKVFADAYQWLGSRPYAEPRRIAALGHCMGGRLGIHFAAETAGLRAAVMFYASVREEAETPARPRHPVRSAALIKCPTLMLYGGQDRITTNATQLRLLQSFMEAGTPLEWHYWSLGLHGFATIDSDSYQPDIGKVGWMLVDEFLQRNLMDVQ
jgi:dienelactone hydrolase